MATVLESIVTPALQEIGVVPGSQAPSAGDSALALARLNRFVDFLAAQRTAIFQITRATATLTANTASFTVGSGGNIATGTPIGSNYIRPVFIEKVAFIDTATDPDTEFSLGDLLTEAEWARIPQKALTGVYPQRAYYSPTTPTGTLYPWPIPTSATLQWAMYYWAALGTFASLATDISLPPAYAEMLVTNLAKLLCPAFTREPSGILISQAAESLAAVKRANRRLEPMTLDPAALVGNPHLWNIRTDQ